jgi:predicted phage terminase large subunit-like protein
MREMPALDSKRFYGASDHAVSITQGNDKTCLMIVGVDQDDDIWIMPDLIWGRYASNIAVEQMINLMEKYKPMMWWAERGQISKSIGPFLRKRMLERRIFCAMDEIVPVLDKQSRSQSIHARMAMRKVHFPLFSRWYSEARDQMLKFPRSGKDDFVDTLGLVGLGLAKQIPNRKMPTSDKGPKELTFGWIKEQTKRRLMEESATDGW